MTIRVYDPLNHMFFSGTGPSTMAEYDPAQHVDSEVIADIASWLMTVLPDARPGEPLKSGV